MEKYLIRNPRTGKIIDNYELVIDEENITIISYKRKNPYPIAINKYTDHCNYTCLRVNLEGNFYFLSNIVYVAITGKPIKNGYIIHHKDLNSLNNMPNNLIEITREEHSIVHSLIRLKRLNRESFIKIKDLVDYAEMTNAIIN